MTAATLTATEILAEIAQSAREAAAAVSAEADLRYEAVGTWVAGELAAIAVEADRRRNAWLTCVPAEHVEVPR